MLRAAQLLLGRDLKLAFRHVSQWANPLIFFVVVSSLFPLALSPERIAAIAQTDAHYGLQILGIGVLWVSALLASLLGLESLFLNDVEDGSMEQLYLSPVPLVGVVYGKLAAHWLVSGLPLIVLVPVIGTTYRLPVEVLGVLALALLLATPTLAVLVAIGAALTVNLRSAGAIIGLLVLPLSSPVLIFGAVATVFALDGDAVAGPLYLLAAAAALALSLGPLAIVAALKVGLE